MLIDKKTQSLLLLLAMIQGMQGSDIKKQRIAKRQLAAEIDHLKRVSPRLVDSKYENGESSTTSSSDDSLHVSVSFPDQEVSYSSVASPEDVLLLDVPMLPSIASDDIGIVLQERDIRGIDVTKPVKDRKKKLSKSEEKEIVAIDDSATSRNNALNSAVELSENLLNGYKLLIENKPLVWLRQEKNNLQLRSAELLELYRSMLFDNSLQGRQKLLAITKQRQLTSVYLDYVHAEMNKVFMQEKKEQEMNLGSKKRSWVDKFMSGAELSY